MGVIWSFYKEERKEKKELKRFVISFIVVFYGKTKKV